MGRKAKILGEGAWYLGKDDKQDYPISYRYVISYAVLALSESGVSKSEALNKLNLLNAAIAKDETLEGTDFLDVFVLDDGWGLVIVDQTDGIYPLVLFTDKRQKADKDERKIAFIRSLKDVIKNFEAIYAYFNGHTRSSWTKEFQEALFEKAHFTNPPPH